MDTSNTRDNAHTAATAAMTELDAWERWSWLWTLIFYGLLALCLFVALVDPAEGSTAEIVVLTLLWGGWYWLMILRTTMRTLWLLLYFTGALALWLLLVERHPFYFTALLSFYSQIYALLPIRWSIPASIVLFAATFLRSFDFTNLADNWVGVIGLIASVVVGTSIALWIAGIIAQSDERKRLLEELAAARRELAVAARQAGILEERQRLAGEIHDTLAQGFTSIVMHLEAAEAALPPDVDPARTYLAQARQTARDSLGEARQFVWALRPPALDRRSLTDALQRLTARWSAESGVRAETTVTGTLRALSPAAEVTLLRAAQESLTNVRKHARATQVILTLSFIDNVVLLDIQDDGVGFSSDALLARQELDGGFGLQTMRERVEQLGGSLVVESAPGEGTTIAVELRV
ncbi:MAG: sensor histidine kinase [Chloroflexales bacterium]|nr:sensor histidine kinase [Chloroflexales bacterium]